MRATVDRTSGQPFDLKDLPMLEPATDEFGGASYIWQGTPSEFLDLLRALPSNAIVTSPYEDEPDLWDVECYDDYRE